AAMHVDQAFRDRQAEAGALLGGFDRIGALAERGQHDRDFVLRDPRAGILDAEILSAGCGPARLEPDLATLRGKLDGVRQQIEHDLARCALIAQDPRHALLDHFVNGTAAAWRRWLTLRDALPRRKSISPARARRSARPFRRALPTSPASSNAGGGRAAQNILLPRAPARRARIRRACRRARN